MSADHDTFLTSQADDWLLTEAGESLIVKEERSSRLLTESGFNLTTESGECLLVEKDLTASAEFTDVHTELENDGSLTVTWDGDFKNIDSFTILHSTDDGETWQEVGTVAGSERSFNFETAALGVTKVVANSASGSAAGSSNKEKDAADDELVKPSYVIIDMAAKDTAGEPRGVNDKGQALLFKSNADGTLFGDGTLWNADETQNLGNHYLFWGPLQDGTVYYGVVDESIAFVSGQDYPSVYLPFSGIHSRTTSKIKSLDSAAAMTYYTDYAVAGSVAVTPTLATGTLNNIAGINNSAALASLASLQAQAETALPQNIGGAITDITVNVVKSSRLLGVTDALDFIYKLATSGDLIYWYQTVAATVLLYGWKNKMTPGRVYIIKKNDNTIYADSGPKISVLFANDLGDAVYQYSEEFIVPATLKVKFMRTGSGSDISGATDVYDLNSETGSEGPYILGTKGSQAGVWSYSNGNFKFVAINGGQGRNETGVMGRKISNELIVPLGDKIWQGNKKRWEKNKPEGKTWPTQEICVNSADWSNINVTLVSPEHSLLVGTATQGGAQRSVLLVPIIIKQLNYPTADDSTDMGPVKEKYIEQGGVAYITGTPEMPKLEISIGNGIISGMNVEWRLEVKSERDERKGRDDFKIPASGTIPLASNQPWKLDDYYAAPREFFGGNITVFYRIKKADGTYLTNNEQQVKFKIRGKNPIDADAKEYIKSNQGDYRFAWAIVQHESRQFFKDKKSGRAYDRAYNQFNCSGKKEQPNYGAPDGWGIAQLDRPLDVSCSTNEVYSWHKNIAKFILELNQKAQDTDQMFAWYKNRYKNDSRWEEPPASYQVSNSKFSARELAIIVLYNGVAGCPEMDKGAPMPQFPWTFNPNGKPNAKWTFTDNTNTVSKEHYATRIIIDEWEGKVGYVE